MDTLFLTNKQRQFSGEMSLLSHEYPIIYQHAKKYLIYNLHNIQKLIQRPKFNTKEKPLLFWVRQDFLDMIQKGWSKVKDKKLINSTSLKWKTCGVTKTSLKEWKRQATVGKKYL